MFFFSLYIPLLFHFSNSNKAKMEVSTMAFLLSNSSSLVPATATAISIVAPTTISTTTTTFTVPFLVTSMSHRNLHIINKASSTRHHIIKDFSPVTLNTEWSSMARLLILACLSVIGSIGNVFMISSVMIEDHLKKAGKCWCICFWIFNFFWIFLFLFLQIIYWFSFFFFSRKMQVFLLPNE